tara:strand:- start:4232 stop:4801 length:570 start_codon:yes stop_codon:yes gene_type:complete
MLKDLQKTIKGHHLISALAAGLVIYMIYRLVSRSSGDQHKDSMAGGRAPSVNAGEVQSSGNAGTAVAAAPEGENETYAAVEGGSPTQGLPPSCNARPVAEPSDLLPKDSSGSFGAMGPQGGGALQNVNLLKAGHHVGINTVGSSLRNANLQLRSEPPNPQTQVSPWLNTTIEPDLMRMPLEAGGRSAGN